MALPLQPPIEPQLARGRADLPPDDDGAWAYEPKWDGFRAIAFVDGDEQYLQSRNGKDLSRYFPEVVLPPGRYVADGELVASTFGTLGNRIHPAASRIERLSQETPARFVAFDLLADGDEPLLAMPFGERRARLVALTARFTALELTPSVATVAAAEPWLTEQEGVVAKLLDAPYAPGRRDAMVKVKRRRTADVVIVGWRPGKAADTVGALILGLYTEDGTLRPIGHCSSFSAKEKRELPALLAPLEIGERGSGDASRWTGDRDLSWVALRPELVAEISYDQVSDGRIRHGTRFVCWREDKRPDECTAGQLDV